MQKGNMTDFDLFVKRSLQDAEEEVSPRVWRGIESRLAAMEAQKAQAASRKNHSFGWGWPAAALAMAAVLAAVIILPGTKRNSNLTNHNDTTLLSDASTGRQVTVSGQDGGESVIAAAGSGIVAEVPAAHGRSSAAGVRNQAVKVSEPQAPQQAAPVAEAAQEPQTEVQAAPQEAAPAAQVAQEPQASHEAVRPAAGQPDEFARMAFEDQMSRKAPVRISALAGGILGAGNSASSAPLYGVSAKNDYIPGDIREEGESSYSIPFSVGVGVRFGLTPRLSVGTGIDYSLLSRNFNGSFTSASGAVTKGNIRHNMQYIGVPLNVYFELLGGGSLRLFAFGTGEAEWALSSKYAMGDETLNYPVHGTQLSAGGGLGVEFRITDGLGLYAAPNARYYFNCGQPKSIRTEKPLLINFNAGLHFYF